MTNYTVTNEDKLELLDIPNVVLPKDALVQCKTYPIRSITEGIKNKLDPSEIANMVYNEMVGIHMDKFTDVGMRNNTDWAKFVQVAVLKKLQSMVQVPSELVP